jgi:hypothetical protein
MENTIREGFKVFLFGTPIQPRRLSGWREYTQNESSNQLRKLYNWSSIYLYLAIKD